LEAYAHRLVILPSIRGDHVSVAPKPSAQAAATSIIAAAVGAGLAAGNTLQSDSTREVDVLAGLFTRGLDELRTKLPPALAALGLQCVIHGVYCHQSPKVTMASAGTCELGDLLVAVRFEHGARSANRALLTQLKVVGRAGPSSAQRRLYERWPSFTYTAWPHAQRKVGPPISHAGAQWGRITLCPRCSGSCAPPECPHTVTLDVEMPASSQQRALSDEIADLIFGGGGREFVERDQAERRKGWDLVVWDLIEVTGKRLMNYARADLQQRARGQSVSLMAEHRIQPFVTGVPKLLQVSALQDEPGLALIGELVGDAPPIEPPTWEEAWDARPDGGISLLLFDVGFQEDAPTADDVARRLTDITRRP
jgi:hypothetical protein